MYLLLAMLLSVGSLPTPAQQQQSAAAVYKVRYQATAIGMFVYRTEEGSVIVKRTQENTYRGTAFAIDPHGWALTARHLVSKEEIVARLCDGSADDLLFYQVRAVHLEIAFTDIAGIEWVEWSIITPTDSTVKNVCRTPHSLKVGIHPHSSLRVEKVDSEADLALVKLSDSRGLVSSLDLGTLVGLPEGSQVYALGFPEGGELTTRTGSLLWACERSLGSIAPAPDVGPDVYHLVPELASRYLMDGRQGMSGGPLIADGKVVGVLISVGPARQGDGPSLIAGAKCTYAVPVDYIQAWYLWVRGLSKDQPTNVCEPTRDFLDRDIEGVKNQMEGIEP